MSRTEKPLTRRSRIFAFKSAGAWIAILASAAVSLFLFDCGAKKGGDFSKDNIKSIAETAPQPAVETPVEEPANEPQKPTEPGDPPPIGFAVFAPGVLTGGVGAGLDTSQIQYVGWGTVLTGVSTPAPSDSTMDPGNGKMTLKSGMFEVIFDK